MSVITLSRRKISRSFAFVAAALIIGSLAARWLLAFYLSPSHATYGGQPLSYWFSQLPLTIISQPQHITIRDKGNPRGKNTMSAAELYKYWENWE